jgi:LuxR family maltose regulon positive regulatory protein
LISPPGPGGHLVSTSRRTALCGPSRRPEHCPKPDASQRRRTTTATIESPLRDLLITTKLGVRGGGGRHVERRRLRDRLDRSPGARLILVSAPAGFGKSTLLADCLEGPSVRGAWLSLDTQDNDVVRFTRYLTAAAARLAGRTGDATPPDAQSFDPGLALAGVLDDLAAAGSGVVLVLDDYHLIDEPAIHRLVGSLIERLPSGSRLAMATRADPPLPLARLRARGELVEIRAEDLRFTDAEAAELLSTAGLELTRPQIELLIDRTEGWAAALRLAAVSLRDRPDQAALVERFGASHRYVLDYIVEEVLAGLPTEDQEFLLRTSILDRLCGPLCEVVAGVQDGQARLQELDRANLLIVALDDERRWWRYHALFAEVLRAHLRASHPDEVPSLHARASAWHESRGEDDEAIRHALRSGDLGRASLLVAMASGTHLNAGELSTVRRWLDALPPEVIRSHAQLSASYAWVLVLGGETGGVPQRLADAERALAVDRDGDRLMRPTLPSQLAMLRSQLAGLEGDSATAVEQARLARDLVPEGLPAEVEATLRGTAAALLGVALARARQLEAAVAAYETALPDLRTAGNSLAVGRTIGDLASIAVSLGDPLHAVELCESELEAAEGTRGSPAVWAALARARVEVGQADLAEVAARRAMEIATPAGDAPSARSAQATLERIELMRLTRPRTPQVTATRDAPVETLTAREVEVLRLVALGRSNSQVAAELFVTVGTVKSHLHTISGKLGAANRVEAVARGRELGILG